ncbi:MAG: HAMP domain-containing sensor histidine kinase [Bacteroidota bacterium]
MIFLSTLLQTPLILSVDGLDLSGVVFMQVEESSRLLNSNLSLAIIIFLLLLAILVSIGFQQKRKANIELHRKNRLIEEQTQLITEKNKTLEEQNQRLKQLNEEKNNIIGVVSHDLKSPLNRIFALSNLILLTGENLNPDQKDYLEKMHQVVKDGLDLIRNLLDIRAIEDKGIEMRYEELDICDFLTRMVKNYKSIAEKKQMKIYYSGEISEFNLHSDYQYLNRIFDNLISNAVKFAPQGSKVYVKMFEYDDHVKVEVIDQGPGISDDDKKKLFQKFQLLSARPTGGESSTGLGLSITKSLVEKLGGKIYCESTLGEGSKFSVELPKQPEEQLS